MGGDRSYGGRKGWWLREEPGRGGRGGVGERSQGGEEGVVVERGAREGRKGWWWRVELGRGGRGGGGERS